MTVHWVFLHCSISQHCPSCKNYHQLSYLGKSWGGMSLEFSKTLGKVGTEQALGNWNQGLYCHQESLFSFYLLLCILISFSLPHGWPVTNTGRRKNRMNSGVLDQKEMEVLYQYNRIFKQISKCTSAFCVLCVLCLYVCVCVSICVCLCVHVCI